MKQHPTDAKQNGFDAIDSQILETLQRDARTPHTHIAAEVGRSAPSVLERIRKLERAGVIGGYHARLNPELLGRPVTAFVGIKVGGEFDEEGSVATLRAMPEIAECHSVAGDQALLLKVRVGTPQELARLINQGLLSIRGVTGTYTTIVLSTYFEDDVLQIPQELEVPDSV